MIAAWQQSRHRLSAARIVGWPIHPLQQDPQAWADDATAWRYVCGTIPIPLSDDDVWLPIKAAALPVPVQQLPRCLQGIADLIEHYWLAKRGSRSVSAFRAVIDHLTPHLLERGPLQVGAFLRSAAQAGYPELDYGRWEQRERGWAPSTP